MTLDSITINSNFDGSMVAALSGGGITVRPCFPSVSTGAENGSGLTFRSCLRRRLGMCRTLRRCLPNARLDLLRFIRKDEQEAVIRTLELESEPVTKNCCRRTLYRELLLRQRINEAAQVVMVALRDGQRS